MDKRCSHTYLNNEVKHTVASTTEEALRLMMMMNAVVGDLRMEEHHKQRYNSSRGVDKGTQSSVYRTQCPSAQGLGTADNTLLG